jgi:chromosome segregation ATPase
MKTKAKKLNLVERNYVVIRVLPSGTSEYKIDQKVVTFAKYVAVLEKQNILVKARNFLVFQGDVEAVASQSPKDLTRLIEQISGFSFFLISDLLNLNPNMKG